MKGDREKLLERLREAERLAGKYGDGDPETAHVMADKALVDFIGDDEVAEAFEAVWKWYA